MRDVRDLACGIRSGEGVRPLLGQLGVVRNISRELGGPFYGQGLLSFILGWKSGKKAYQDFPPLDDRHHRRVRA